MYGGDHVCRRQEMPDGWFYACFIDGMDAVIREMKAGTGLFGVTSILLPYFAGLSLSKDSS